VVTGDIPLADRCLKAGAIVIGPTGKPFTPDSIGAALAGRAVGEHLRSMGEKPSTEDEVGQYLMEAIAIAKAANTSTTEYAEAKKKLVEMPDTPAPSAEKPKDPTLEADVNKSRRVGG